MSEFLRLFAYEFETDLSMAEILVRVRDVTGWKWFQRDSDRWGEYFVGVARPSENFRPERTSRVKLLELDPKKFALNILYESSLPDAEEDFEALHREIYNKVLPALGARCIERAEDYE